MSNAKLRKKEEALKKEKTKEFKFEELSMSFKKERILNEHTEKKFK